MYISYSGYKMYLECLKAYFLRYILREPPPNPMNRVHMLYGEAVGQLFEEFYAKELWRGKTTSEVAEQLSQMVKPRLDAIIARETSKGGVFDWGEKNLKIGNRSLEEVEQEVREAIPRGIDIILHHRLVSNDAKAEVVLDQTVKGHKIAGRADFIMSRIKPHSDLVIVDGKGSRWRHKYVHNRQLKWYAMLNWMKTGIIPDKLGFLFWRYDPGESMDWFETSKLELEELKDSILTSTGDIEQKKKLVRLRKKEEAFNVFLPRVGSHCNLCDYFSICEEAQAALSKEGKAEMKASKERGVEDGEVSL